MTYADHAATSFPKAPGVASAMADFLTGQVATTHRRGHAARTTVEAMVDETRARVLDVIDGGSEGRVVLTANATDAANLALRGYLRRGDHVVTSTFEHAAVSSTLSALRDDGTITFTRVAPDAAGQITADQVRRAMRPETRLVAMIHASNVTGDVVLHDSVATVRSDRVALFLDASQSIGSVPFSVRAWGADLVAFSGHKALLGPPGVGCLFVRDGVELRPYRTGGTGRALDPGVGHVPGVGALETGTQNTVGIAGLHAALGYLAERTVDEVIAHKRAMVTAFVDGVRSLGAEDLTLYGAVDHHPRLPLVSLTMTGAPSVEFLGPILQHGYGIVTRSGLHCSPWAHDSLGTRAGGTVRFSFGASTTLAEVDRCVESLGDVHAAGANPEFRTMLTGAFT